MTNENISRGSNSAIFIFSSPVRMYRKSYCTSPGIGGGGGVVGMDKVLKFYFKVF